MRFGIAAGDFEGLNNHSRRRYPTAIGLRPFRARLDGDDERQLKMLRLDGPELLLGRRGGRSPRGVRGPPEHAEAFGIFDAGLDLTIDDEMSALVCVSLSGHALSDMDERIVDLGGVLVANHVREKAPSKITVEEGVTFCELG